MLKKKASGRQKEIHGSVPGNRNLCIRCGMCCRKGGPILHREDLRLISDGQISCENLITIRKDELAFSPLSGRLEPVQEEVVKLAGKEKGKGWTCCLYDERKSSCKIYRHRPLECRLLKCWDTSALLSVINKDTITRFDIISKGDPIIKFIEMHERQCPVQQAEDLVSALLKKNENAESGSKLTALIYHDLTLRSKAIHEFKLSLAAELFYFGRPLFKILSSRGTDVNEINMPAKK